MRQGRCHPGPLNPYQGNLYPAGVGGEEKVPQAILDPPCLLVDAVEVVNALRVVKARALLVWIRVVVAEVAAQTDVDDGSRLHQGGTWDAVIPSGAGAHRS